MIGPHLGQLSFCHSLANQDKCGEEKKPEELIFPRQAAIYSGDKQGLVSNSQTLLTPQTPQAAHGRCFLILRKRFSDKRGSAGQVIFFKSQKQKQNGHHKYVIPDHMT